MSQKRDMGHPAFSRASNGTPAIAEGRHIGGKSHLIVWNHKTSLGRLAGRGRGGHRIAHYDKTSDIGSVGG